MAVRISQVVPEALAIGASEARVSQVVAESIAIGQSKARASQIVIEVLIPVASAITNVRVSQLVQESAIIGHSLARLSQLVLECLTPNIEVGMPAVYPTLPGLAYSVLWEPQFFNMPTAKSASGAEIDLGLGALPLHQFTLTYNFLRDRFGNAEFKTMMGFFLTMGGNLGRFLFKNPDDYEVSQQPIGTTDGTTHAWQLVRAFGAGENIITEPIGYADLTSTFNVYLNGVLQPSDSYTVNQTEPVNQQLIFNNTPSSAQKITVDMSYYYYCKFTDPNLSFEKFMNQIWSLKTVVIQSNRAGT